MKYKLAHTCIRVLDLEKSLAFYRDGFGLVEKRREDVPEYKCTLVYLSDIAGHYEIELTYNHDQVVPYELGDGFGHIALTVEDLETAYANHQNLGYEVTDLKGLPGSLIRYYFVIDPDGYKVEVIQKN